jgi:hypothetical protein
MTLEWFGPVIAGVCRQRLADRVASSLVAASPPGAELELLEEIAGRWMPEVRVVRLTADEVRDAASSCGVELSPDDLLRDTPQAAAVWEGAARILAAGTSGLPVSTANRTALILSGPLPLVPLAPLGDLPASLVRAARGACALPHPFQGVAEDGDLLADLDRALERWAAGTRPEDAAAELAMAPDLRSELVRRLRVGPVLRGSACVVPKLGDPTPGIDLDV